MLILTAAQIHHIVIEQQARIRRILMKLQDQIRHTLIRLRAQTVRIQMLQLDQIQVILTLHRRKIYGINIHTFRNRTSGNW